jgi:hypothetical protein
MKLLDWLRTDADPNPDEWENYDLHAAIAFALMHSHDLTAEEGKWYDLNVSFSIGRHHSGDRVAVIDGIRVTPNKMRRRATPSDAGGDS